MEFIKTKQKLECLVCGFKSNEQGEFKHLRHHDRWDLYQCSKCAFQFWDPPGQAPKEFFEEHYKDFADILIKPTLALRHKLILKLLPIKKGTILDIGCGVNLFLTELHKRGFNVFGVDFNRKAIEKAKKLFGLKNLYPLSIYDFALLPNLPKFDLITLFEVFEHIEALKEFILTIKNLLNNKGFVALSVPDVKMFGPWEYSCNIAPYHTAYWTPETLKIFLTKNNFEIITMKKISRLDTIALLINVLIKLKLIKNTSLPSNNDDKSSNDFKIPLRSSGLLKKVLISFYRIISSPFREFLYILGFRSTIFVIAQLKN